MPTSSHTLAAAALATAATGAIAIAGSRDVPVAAALDAPRKLTFTEPFVGGHRQRIDLGKKGFGAGDMQLTTDVPLYDARTRRRVGTSDGMETILSTRHNGTMLLHGTARLPDGRIEMVGLLRHSDTTQTGVIVGGTGAYANARGQATVTEDTERKRNIITVTLTTPTG